MQRLCAPLRPLWLNPIYCRSNKSQTSRTWRTWRESLVVVCLATKSPLRSLRSLRLKKPSTYRASCKTYFCVSRKVRQVRKEIYRCGRSIFSHKDHKECKGFVPLCVLCGSTPFIAGAIKVRLCALCELGVRYFMGRASQNPQLTYP